MIGAIRLARDVATYHEEKKAMIKRAARFILLSLVASQVFAPAIAAAPLDDVLAAARKEKEVDFYAPSTITPIGAQKLCDAFNKKYGLEIQLNYHPSGSMSRDVAKVITYAAAGLPPEWDLMVVTDATHVPRWQKKLHRPFDYAKLGVAPESIQYDNGTVILANQFVLPAYNKRFLSPQDVPKTWEDLLDPKWKGGKLGMGTAGHHLARLATVWGEKKTTEFVHGLAKQQPSLGQHGTIFTRLILGEILIAITMTDSFLHRAELAKAPIVHAEAVEPVISPAYNAGVPKNARHPNTAHLLAAFLTSPEAQQIWETYGGQTSAFTPGTKAYAYAKGKKVVFMKQEQADLVARLAREYTKIIGF
jgi:iron(III) transport system substrate-binding protein